MPQIHDPQLWVTRRLERSLDVRHVIRHYPRGQKLGGQDVYHIYIYIYTSIYIYTYIYVFIDACTETRPDN